MVTKWNNLFTKKKDLDVKTISSRIFACLQAGYEVKTITPRLSDMSKILKAALIAKEYFEEQENRKVYFLPPSLENAIPDKEIPAVITFGIRLANENEREK